MKVRGFDLAERTLVVAEVGNNHEGSLDVAAELVRQAAAAGAHAVKFQTFTTERFVSPADTARFARLKSFELGREAFVKLHDLARSLGLLFLSTPLDLGSAAFLEPLVDAFKVASGDNDFFPLLARVARVAKPLIVSTGASDLAHVRRTVDFVRRARQEAGLDEDLVLLHCVSSYPAPPAEIHLGAIPLLAAETGCPVGYSDHTIGIEAAALAPALGAVVVEKHFTLRHDFSDFRDHTLSATPAEMAELVRRVALATTLLGRRAKELQPCELASADAIRRSVVAVTDLAKGHQVTLADLDWRRPAGGLRPGSEETLLGRRLTRDVAAGERFRADDVE